MGDAGYAGPDSLRAVLAHATDQRRKRARFFQHGGTQFEPLGTRGHAERFPGLQLAWDVLAGPPGSTAVLNAANEVAVAAFLARTIRFDQIHAVNTDCLAKFIPAPPGSLSDLLEIDAQARAFAQSCVQRLSASGL